MNNVDYSAHMTRFKLKLKPHRATIVLSSREWLVESTTRSLYDILTQILVPTEDPPRFKFLLLPISKLFLPSSERQLHSSV